MVHGLVDLIHVTASLTVCGGRDCVNSGQSTCEQFDVVYAVKWWFN